jgi:hypothetical protein
MTYSKPEIVALGSATACVQGPKQAPTKTDIDRIHTLSAYEADE